MRQEKQIMERYGKEWQKRCEEKNENRKSINSPSFRNYHWCTTYSMFLTEETTPVVETEIEQYSDTEKFFIESLKNILHDPDSLDIVYCLRFFRPLPKGRLCYNTISIERSL